MCIRDRYDVPQASKEYLNENFKWEKQPYQKEDMSIGNHYVLVRKKASTLFTMDNCLKRVLDIIKSVEKIQLIEQDLMKKKESISFIPEANPFGDDNLAIAKDSVYLFRMVAAGENTPIAIGWVEFNPLTATLTEYSLNVTTNLAFNRSLLKRLPSECSN